MLGSGAFAVLAGAVGRKLQVLFRAEHGGPQIYGELFELIAARLATWYRTVAGTSTEGVEELAEHVAHVESAEGLAATVSRSASGIVRIDAHVEHTPLLRVGKHFVRGVDLLEFLLELRTREIGMVFTAHLAVCALDLLFRRIALDT